MVKKSPVQNQINMFEIVLSQMISPDHALVLLAKKINWGIFEREFSRLYSDTGRPGHPIRMMVGFLMLKQLYNLSDENVVERWVENPYWQHFTGEIFFKHEKPFDPSEFVHFRKRIGIQGAELIFKQSIDIHGEDAKEAEVVVDTTVQEKNITFPTDTKLRRKVIEKCMIIANNEGIRLSRTFAKERKAILLILRFRNNLKRRGEVKKADKRYLTIAGRILRELKRELVRMGRIALYADDIEIYERVLAQRRKDKNKIYSLHEPKVSCIAKGKEHKPYEFGSKVSIATTKTRGIVVGAISFEGNPYDGNTLAPTLDQTERLTGKRPENATCDRGYRGRKVVKTTTVHIPTPPPKGQTKAQANAVRKRFRRRTAIEPRISHLKQDYRMGRNFLKGVAGDSFNLLMATTAWNLRLWIISLSMLFTTLRNLLGLARMNVFTLFSRSSIKILRARRWIYSGKNIVAQFSLPNPGWIPNIS